MPHGFDFFPLYAHRILSSRSVRSMDATEFGGYMFLLIESFINNPQGYLQDDDADLRRLARMTDGQWAQSREKLMKNFRKRQTDLIYNPTMLDIIKELRAKRDKRVSAGRKGASKRWGDDGNANSNAKDAEWQCHDPVIALNQTRLNKRGNSNAINSNAIETAREHAIKMCRMAIGGWEKMDDEERNMWIDKYLNEHQEP